MLGPARHRAIAWSHVEARLSAFDWLRGLFGRTTTSWQPGDQVWCGGEAWTVTAVIVERDARRQWPTLRLARGSDVVWITVDGDDVVRYDPLPDVRLGADERIAWNGHTYTVSERGAYEVVRVAGDVNAAVGDRAQYLTLTAPDDANTWLSVERWEGGTTEVSAARPWTIERVLHAPPRRAT